MSYQLTAGFCKRAYDAPEVDEELLNSAPTLQFLSFKRIGPPGSDRYRIIVSDGEHFLQWMLATQLNHLIDESHITKHTIATIDKFTSNILGGKRIFVILGLHVIAKEAEKIGAPTVLPSPANDESAAPSAAMAAPAVPPTSAAAVAGGSNAQAPRQQNQGNKANRTSIYPIESLSPYQNHWTIKVRVTQKSDMKHWSNQKGEGKLFNVTLMDETGEIRATAFNNVADELYEKLQEGRVYLISKARVNLAKKQFSNLTNEYELGLERNTEIEECHDAADVPALRFNFVQLSDLINVPKDSNVDVVGIVREVGDPSEITTKTGNKLAKRELTLVDRSGFSIRLTLWAKNAEQWAVDEEQPVVAFKGVRVGDFGGRSLSMQGSSSMVVNPDVPEAHALRGWYDAAGNGQEYQNFNGVVSGISSIGGFNRAEVKCLNDIREGEYGMQDKPEFFSIRATVVHIKGDNIAYPACPNERCNKKVIHDGDGWRCEKCSQTFPKPEYRYIISMAVSDYSGQLWLQGFNDIGRVLFGMSADELFEIRDRNESEYERVMETAVGVTYNYYCRAKQDTYNDTPRMRYAVSRIYPLDFKAECEHMLQLLKSPWGAE